MLQVKPVSACQVVQYCCCNPSLWTGSGWKGCKIAVCKGCKGGGGGGRQEGGGVFPSAVLPTPSQPSQSFSSCFFFTSSSTREYSTVYPHYQYVKQKCHSIKKTFLVDKSVLYTCISCCFTCWLVRQYGHIAQHLLEVLTQAFSATHHILQKIIII